jgi:hypothetical protein
MYVIVVRRINPIGYQSLVVHLGVYDSDAQLVLRFSLVLSVITF